MYVSYSRNRNDYKKGSRYSSLHFGYRNTIKTIDYLKKNQYIEDTKGLWREKNPRQSRMRATPKLITLIKDTYKVATPMIKGDEKKEIIILKGEKDKKGNAEKIDYVDTEETIQMRKNLKLINRNLQKHAILLSLPDTKLKEIIARLRKNSNKGQIDFTDKRLHRTFNNGSFHEGGRFYGGWWQNIPREYRKFIRINDKDVVELDYSGLHINMLYAMEKSPIPEGDVYHLEGYSNTNTFRKFVKQLLQAFLNASSREEAWKAINGSVHRKNELELPDEIPSTKEKDIFPLMDAFELKHEKIKHYFCTGKGINLQNLDSQMAEKVLLKFSAMGYAILPMHDSFIIHHGLEEELRKAMEDAFFELFGVKCKVNLKYNSILKRRKIEKEGPKICETPLKELLDAFCENGEYGTYFRLLHEHQKYCNPNI
jgi:hypothetical protein